MHTLQGHSIVPPSSPPVQTQVITDQSSILAPAIAKSPVQLAQEPEKSSSSTTASSQLTNSDQYVSYAIHEMGDSSQERLSTFPIAADIPIYASWSMRSNDNKDQRIVSDSITSANQNMTKDDDLTELDATENLTSYSDDILLRKRHSSARNRQQNFDASSTDEDVDDENFNEYEQHDLSNLYRIFDEITQHTDSSSGGYGQIYLRYNLSSNSSTSGRTHIDDVYMIPEYCGLWRPSTDDCHRTYLPFSSDADDEDEKDRPSTTPKTLVSCLCRSHTKKHLTQKRDASKDF